ncbi:MAG TPA: DoxX family protein [Pseudomonadales bacterium]
MTDTAQSANLATAQRLLLITGRALLGLYFIVPGITKITGWTAMSAYMAQHGVPLVPVLLVLTIVLQIGGGACLAIGYRTQLMALLLAGLTLVISVFMHDFWNTYDGTDPGHETQNFIKNLAIMAGLLCVAGSRDQRS